MTICAKQLWQVTLWQLLTSKCNTLLQSMTNFDRQLLLQLTIFDKKVWQPLTICDKDLWQHLTIYNEQLWQSATISDKGLYQYVTSKYEKTSQVFWTLLRFPSRLIGQPHIIVNSKRRWWFSAVSQVPSMGLCATDTKVINNCKALIHGVVGSICARYVDLGLEVLGLGVQKTRDSGSFRLASWPGGLFLGLSSSCCIGYYLRFWGGPRRLVVFYFGTCA